MLKLCVVILNYRTPDLTIGALESLLPDLNGRTDRMTIVVDNCSADGSAEAIEFAIKERMWEQWARVVRSPINGGFSAGNNVGIAAIDAENYLLMNSDARVLPGAIDTLLDTLESEPEVSILGPRLQFEDGVAQVSSFRFISPISEMLAAAGTGLIDRSLSRFVVSLPLADQLSDADWVSFACVMVRRRLVNEIGLLDEGYFMYFDDVDYCRRAKRAGWRVRYQPAAKAVHLRGGSASLKSDAAARRKLPRYQFESRSQYFAKYYGGVIGILSANVLWTLGRSISLVREIFRTKKPHTCQDQFFDIWINCLRPMRRSSYLEPKNP